MIAICLSFKQIGYPSDPMTNRKHNLRVIKMIKITHKKEQQTYNKNTYTPDSIHKSHQPQRRLRNDVLPFD